MGQAKRRKAEIEQLKTGSARSRAPLVAIHEAGHAVARFLTADLMGYPPEGAVSYIEMHDPKTTRKFLGTDGKLYMDSATTYGHWFSRDIDAAIETYNKRYSREELKKVAGTEAYARAVMAEARKAGADIDAWGRAKIAIILGGSVAEARATGKTVDAIMDLPEIQGDFDDAVRTGQMTQWSEDQADIEIHAALAMIEEKFAQPNIWRALLRLAAALPREGRMEGADAWAIFKQEWSGITA
jgi:hypothetical protein